jgi:calcineurin-like phosphoesterase family protein
LTAFFTADPHFGHANIIRYCNRPFAEADAMDAAIAERCNAVVKPDDVLYVLGDFCMGVTDRLESARRYRAALACREVHFVWGNHDPQGDDDFASLFTTAEHLRHVRLGGRRITLCHYAMRAWDKSHHGSWQLYGHTHGQLPEMPEMWNFDVGVDCWNFYPISLEQIGQVMEHKKAGGWASDWTIEAGALVRRAGAW